MTETSTAVVSAAADFLDEGPRTLASAIHARLRADILTCQLLPGEKLLIAPLGRRFRVSLASVREALSRLVADGLLVAEDQRGFRVSPISTVDLMDLTQTRIEIECLALRRSMERGGEAWRREVREAWDALRSVPYVDAEDEGRHHEAWSVRHGQFHEALVSACGLDWLMRFRGTLFEQSERYRRIGRAIGPRTRDARKEHEQIFEAVIAGDVAAATALLAEHFERTADMIEAACREKGLMSDRAPKR